ncbi:hypothetical protein Tsp_11730 [Trichinella spiralis]|uniref:hypothetical protein n=1 Tax=Trichinella spiralis TaxID=6334 RepID=UPI0001EFE6EA|nr:hypothetical protein Tsp_11730 [Trichinella spiralis]
MTHMRACVCMCDALYFNAINFETNLSCVSLLSLSVVSCVVCVDTSDESRLKNVSHRSPFRFRFFSSVGTNLKFSSLRQNPLCVQYENFLPICQIIFYFCFVISRILSVELNYGQVTVLLYEELRFGNDTNVEISFGRTRRVLLFACLVGWPIELLLLHSPSAAAAAPPPSPSPLPPPPLPSRRRRRRFLLSVSIFSVEADVAVGRVGWKIRRRRPSIKLHLTCLGTIDGARFCSEEEQFVEKKKEKAAANRKGRII